MGRKVSCCIYWPRLKQAKHLLTSPLGATRKRWGCCCLRFLEATGFSWWHTLARVCSWGRLQLWNLKSNHHLWLQPLIITMKSDFFLSMKSILSLSLSLSKGPIANSFRKEVPRTWTNGAQGGQWQTSDHTVQNGGNPEENQRRGPLLPSVSPCAQQDCL